MATIRSASVSTVEEIDSRGTILFGHHMDHQAILDDNARARAMGRTVDTSFEPVARYHPTMIEHWLQRDGIRRLQFISWPRAEQLAYIARNIRDRDYRKLMRREERGLFI